MLVISAVLSTNLIKSLRLQPALICRIFEKSNADSSYLLLLLRRKPAKIMTCYGNSA